MKKLIVVSFLSLGFLFLTGCNNQQENKIIKPEIQSNSSNIKTYDHSNIDSLIPKNSKGEKLVVEKFGIEFTYPDFLKFKEDDVGDNPIFIYSNTANYKSTEFILYVMDKKKSEKGINFLININKNIYLKNKIPFSGGDFIGIDGYNPGKMYFMDAYYISDKYIYHFQSINDKYSKEILELFESVVGTTKIIN